MEKDVLILGGYVLTCDPANRGGRLDLLIRQGRIAGLAPAGTLPGQFPEAQRVDASGRLILPALINAHFHPESVLLRPLTDGVHFALWAQDPSIRSASAKLLEPASRDDVRSLMLASSFSHVKSGTTTVGLFPPLFDGPALQILSQAASRAELRCVFALQNWQQVEQAQAGLPGARGFMLNLGSDQDFTVYSLSNLLRTARETTWPLLAHVAEQREDEETVRRNFQKSLGQVLRDLGLLQPDTVLVHGNHLQEPDLESLEQAGCTVVLCARSAAHKQTGCPLLRRLASRNIKLALGSDWANLDMFEEMRFLAGLPRLIPGVPAFSPVEILRMATINGAVALGVAGEVGSLEQGKDADLVFLSLHDLRLPALPPSPGVRELAEYLVTHLTAQHISGVMIRGQFAVSGGALATMTEEDLLGGFRVTLDQWYTSPKAEETPPAEVITPLLPHPAKIPPLVERDETETPEEEGYEEGFTVLGPRPGIPRADQSVRRPEVPEKPPLNPPELPTDVRREFGEDDA
jgi:5-methylthioadenosine/S-adenosylhomocysteine deaminase